MKRKTNLAAILFCLIGTVFLYTREEREYKIVLDEPNIINTSLNLHLHRDPAIRESSYIGSENQPSSLDKRPFFFAFLVSLAHDLFGYNVSNGHLINFLLTFGFLIAIYCLLSRLKNSQAGNIGVGAFSALPLMAQNASGLGFEIANLFMLACSMLAALAYWKSPEDRRLGLFLFTIILLAHTRYESAMYAFPAGVIILTKWIQTRTVSLPTSLLLCPLFFIPIAWQNRIIQIGADDFLQLSGFGISKPFGTEYILPNLSEALIYFSGINQTLAGSLILGPCGMISLAIVLGNLFASPKQRILESNLFPIIVISLTTIISFLMLMTFYWGKLGDPSTTRLSLPLWMLSLLSLSIVLSNFPTRFRHIPTAVLAIAFIHAIPIMAAHEYSKTNIPIARDKWIRDTLGQELNSRTLIVSNFVRIYQNRRIPSIGIDRLNHASNAFGQHLGLHTYESVFVVQSGHYTGSHPVVVPKINSGNEIAPMYELELVAEASFYPYNFTRISRVVGFDREKLAIENAKPIEERSYLNKKGVHFIPITPETLTAWEKQLP